jgi:hypothetical protein
MKNSSEIENYPGVVGEITGMELMNPWLPQSTKFGLIHEMVNVIRVSKEGDVFTIHKLKLSKNHFVISEISKLPDTPCIYHVTKLIQSSLILFKILLRSLSDILFMIFSKCPSLSHFTDLPMN